MRAANDCPACGIAAAGDGADAIVHCRACGHSWLMLTHAEQQTAEQAIYTAGYAGYKSDPELARNTARLLQALIAPRVAPGARILDVGCGAGTFLKVAGDAGYDARGLDVSEGAAALCRAKGCDAEAADFLAWGDDASFDVVTMWDVLEHLHDPLSFLDRSARLLRPGGLFLAKVPTYGRFSIALGKRTIKLRAVLLDAPDHTQYYNTGSLAALFARSTLRTETLERMKTGIRTPPSGGMLKRRLARQVKRAIAIASGDGNALIVARSGKA